MAVEVYAIQAGQERNVVLVVVKLLNCGMDEISWHSITNRSLVFKALMVNKLIPKYKLTLVWRNNLLNYKLEDANTFCT